MASLSACAFMDTREKAHEAAQVEQQPSAVVQEEVAAEAPAGTATGSETMAAASSEEQKNEIRNQLSEIARTLSSYLKFDLDSAAISETAAPQLKKMAELLSQLPEDRVRLSGFTDSQGERDYNQVLSQKRVESVRDYLTQYGVRGEQIEMEALGETAPVASNSTESGRSLIRRVEVAISGSAG